MKKKIGIVGAGVLGAALALGGGLGTPVVASQSPVQSQEHNQMLAPDGIPELVIVKNRETGAIRMRRGYGTSPKEYGQWLQGRGRQRWTRSGGVVGGRSFGKQVFG